jgi:hypothetical protein
MKIKRAVLCGALLWVLIFFEVCILMFGLKLQPERTYYIIHYILSGIIAFIAAFIYFGKGIKKGFKEGLLVGIIFAITGIILDSIITIPLFNNFDYSFLLNIYLWFGIIEGIIIVTIVGSLKK